MRGNQNHLDGFGEKGNCDGFKVAPGMQRTTTGINFWKKMYIVDNPNVQGGKMGVILMDTQGLWDPETGNELNCSIYGLSCMLSSYLIANNKGVITSEFIKQLSNLTKFSRDLKEVTAGKPFQHMDILLRDHMGINSNSGTMEDVKQVNQEQKSGVENSPAFAQFINEIKSCFQTFGVRCLPHPGFIDQVGYNGEISKISNLFLVALGHYIESIVMNLQPRTMDGVVMTGSMFIEYAIYFLLFLCTVMPLSAESYSKTRIFYQIFLLL